MTDADKKAVTEWLGECWHEKVSNQRDDANRLLCTCGKRFASRHALRVHVGLMKDDNRTFTTPADLMACFDRLVELGEWTRFEEYSHDRWYRDDNAIISENEGARDHYIKWLHGKNPDGTYRLYTLIAEAIKGGVI